jgi:hypothetical protein
MTTASKPSLRPPMQTYSLARGFHPLDGVNESSTAHSGEYHEPSVRPSIMRNSHYRSILDPEIIAFLISWLRRAVWGRSMIAGRIRLLSYADALIF